MYELTTGKSDTERFIDGYVTGYFESFDTIGDEPGGPVIENLAVAGELYMPWTNEYYYVPNAFRFHFALRVWPDTLPPLPAGVLAKVSPHVQNHSHRTLMSLLDDKQLELLYDWHRTVVAKGGQQRQQVPLRTLGDLLFVFDDVIVNAYQDDLLVDSVFENEFVFHQDVSTSIEQQRLHHLEVTTQMDGEVMTEALYCVGYTRLIDEWVDGHGELGDLAPKVHHAYKGGGFSCTT